MAASEQTYGRFIKKKLQTWLKNQNGVSNYRMAYQIIVACICSPFQGPCRTLSSVQFVFNLGVGLFIHARALPFVMQSFRMLGELYKLYNYYSTLR